MKNRNNSSTSSEKFDFIFNLEISKMYKKYLCENPKFVIIYDDYLTYLNYFINIKKNVLAKILLDLKIEEIIPIQIRKIKSLKILETEEFLNSNLTNEFSLDINNIFEQLEELHNIIKTKYLNIIVISNGNFSKINESKINEIILKLKKKFLINLRIIKINEINNSESFKYFIELNNKNKNINNYVITLNEKVSNDELIKDLYDFYNDGLNSGWKIVKKNNEILKIPYGNAKEMNNINEEIFFLNFNEKISSLSQKTAINKTLSNQFSLNQNDNIISFCKELYNLTTIKKIKNQYENIIRGLERINKDSKISNLNNRQLANYINKSSEKIIEEKKKNIKEENKTINEQKNNIQIININNNNNNNIINKKSNRISIDSNKSNNKNEKPIKILTNNKKITKNNNNEQNNTFYNKNNNKSKITTNNKKNIEIEDEKNNEIVSNLNKSKNQKNFNVNNSNNQNKNIINNNQNNNNQQNICDIQKNSINLKNNNAKENTKSNNISDLKKNLSKSVATKNPTFILIIDSSKYMEKYINQLVKNLLYNLLIKLNYNEKEKIYLYAYNSEDVEERYLNIEKLKNLNIETEGERDIVEVFDKIYNLLRQYKGKDFRILFFTSGQLETKNLSLAQTKLYAFDNEMQNIKVQIIKYKINDNSIFTKNDDTILDILNELNTRKDQNFLEINVNNPISENIDKISKTFIKN